jgi:glycosyltransferase involved in cell wall biosynthesis
MMRVLLIPYPGTWRIEGGHKTQVLQTARALHSAGVEVAIGDVRLARSSAADVVHYFGDPRPLLDRGRPAGRFVVSPVYFPAWFEIGPHRWRGGRRAWAAAQLRHHLRSIRRPGMRRRQWADIRTRLRAMAQADVIVTQSRAETRLLEADADGLLPDVRVAHNGVDPCFFDGAAAQGRSIVGDEPFVLSVGRIEPRKNQLTLARAMRSVSRRLVLVGAVLPGNEGYLRACTDALPSLVHLPHMDRRVLPHVYAAADVHVLPSWYETTGLATLEAMAAGAPCVAGLGPCVEDYFAGADGVRLNRPGDERGLCASILAALEEPRGRGRDLAARYTWDRTARELLDAYQR